MHCRSNNQNNNLRLRKNHMQTVTLNNGTRIPQIGLVVFQITDQTHAKEACLSAFGLGYRHIDTAHHYHNEAGVGAAVISARRAGNTATFDELNKYFTISQMLVVSFQYWNQVHGYTAEDVEKDKEGLQTMRTPARNMAFMIKAIQLAKEKYGLSEKEKPEFTRFCDGLK